MKTRTTAVTVVATASRGGLGVRAVPVWFSGRAVRIGKGLIHPVPGKPRGRTECGIASWGGLRTPNGTTYSPRNGMTTAFDEWAAGSCASGTPHHPRHHHERVDARASFTQEAPSPLARGEMRAREPFIPFGRATWTLGPWRCVASDRITPAMQVGACLPCLAVARFDACSRPEEGRDGVHETSRAEHWR